MVSDMLPHYYSEIYSETFMTWNYGSFITTLLYTLFYILLLLGWYISPRAKDQ